ncbi:MAG: hypothetical protein V5789_06920 [Colwellia sp.]
MSLNDKIQLFSVVVALISVYIAVSSSRSAKKSANESKRSSDLAEATYKSISYEKVRSLPALEVLETVEVDGKSRVKLKIYNLRDLAFKIDSVNASIYKPKRKSLVNRVKHWFNEFDWDYEEIDNIVWNPKGNLDNKEYFVKDAAEFSLVKEQEIILITIPDLVLPCYSAYRFQVKTTFGLSEITCNLHGNNTFFCTNSFIKIS